MPPAVAAIGAAGIGAAGSIIGGEEAASAKQDAANKAAEIRQQAVEQYDNVDIPTIQQQQIQLQKIANAGNLTPEQEQTFQQNQSILNSYQSNPEAFTAQMQALKQLQQIGSQGGLTAVDKAQINQIQTQLGNQEQSNRNAILQNANARGMGGSGVALASQLAGNQAATQAAADQGFNVAAQAQQRALAAIQGAGQLGTGIEGQQFGEASQKAQAQNAINQFNTANAQNIAGQNVQRANYAQERNLNNQQQVNSANTGLANQQEVYNKSLAQSQFTDQLQKAQGKANALGAQANQASTSGDAAANLYSGIGQAASKAGTAVGSYLVGNNSDTKKNTDDTNKPDYSSSY